MADILTKAVLVNLSIGQFNPKRQDAKTTAEVLEDKNAKKSAGVWMKNLIDPKKLDEVTSKSQAARQEHYRLSLPWTDEGWRILPVATYQKYQDKMREARKEYEEEVNKFVMSYPQYIQEARLALNGMFNPMDYPSQDAVREKFTFRVNVSPLPSGSDFRVSLSKDEMDNLHSEVEARVKEATALAMKDLWQRLATPVKAMADKLKDTDGIFRDSLVNNIRSIVALIPSLNIAGDTTLEDIANEVKDTLTRLNADEIRQDTKARQAIADKAEELFKKMQGYV